MVGVLQSGEAGSRLSEAAAAQAGAASEAAAAQAGAAPGAAAQAGAAPGAAGALEAFGARLAQADRGLHVAPIRHHSPACAWAVRALIRDVRPRRVLIEAPLDLTEHVDLLLDPATRPPVAIAVLIEREKDKEARLAAYYPFCAHSPEYVALVEARAIGAEIELIDLPAGDEAMLRRERHDRPDRPVVLGDEGYFDTGSYVAALCRRLGCRNGYELWDHLFESRLGEPDWRRFFVEVGTYCAALRAATPVDTIEENGDLAREAHMRAAVEAALAGGGPVVAVVGGFHAPALLHLASAGAVGDPPGPCAQDGVEKLPQGDVEKRRPKTRAQHSTPRSPSRSYLIRYGFAALDALSGYAAGLPQPGYYEHLWRRANEAAGAPAWRATALDLVSDFAARSRAAGRDISVPAQVEVVRAAEALAVLRGRPGAMRYDLIDAVRAALVKGEASAREAWTERLLEFLRGNAIGDIPASAGSPPLVEDARRRARALKIDVTDGARRRRKLDIRRKPSHLAASRYFHAMALLETGFGNRDAGPDYLLSLDTDRLFEEWSYAWSPHVEGRLIEASVHADDVPGACVAVLDARRTALEEAGRGRDLAAVIGLFAQGLLAGLGGRLEPFLERVAADIQTHGDFAMVAHALRRLHFIERSAGPLGAPPTLDLAGAREAAYLRLVHLCDDLPSTPEEEIGTRLEALRLVTELLKSIEPTVLDHTLFDEAIDRIAGAACAGGTAQRGQSPSVDGEPAQRGQSPRADGQPIQPGQSPLADGQHTHRSQSYTADGKRAPPEILGAVLAICVQAKRRDPTELCAALEGSFSGTVDAEEDRIGVLRGVLHAAPDLLWRAHGVLAVVDRLLSSLSDDAFVALLPHIRLAFSALNPRETDVLAEKLARLHGGETADFAGARHAFSERDLERGLAIERQLRESLEADGLAAFFEEAGR